MVLENPESHVLISVLENKMGSLSIKRVQLEELESEAWHATTLMFKESSINDHRALQADLERDKEMQSNYIAVVSWSERTKRDMDMHQEQL
jgi:hypothetical protein